MSQVVPCWRCGASETEYVFGPLMHPGTNWCARCLVEVELEGARKAARKLAELERRLVELGGPAEQILCGYAFFKLEGDTFEFGQFCWANKGHKGFHQPTDVPAGLA